MRLGWMGYTSLRRDLLAPINNIDQYVRAVPELGELSGELVHWMPLKALTPSCHLAPDSADQDERYAHAECYHYGDNFRPMMRHVNAAPIHERYWWLEQNPYDFEQLRYEVPELDVVIIEATGHQGSLYGVCELTKALYLRNPDLGIILIDQDITGLSTLSKLNKWHPDLESRTILATYHPVWKRPHQAFLAIPHMDHRERTDVVVDGDELCYVGNDYLRREAMLRFFQDEKCHVYGRMKSEFHPELVAAGATVHGAFVPSSQCSVEDLYRKHGVGLNILREDYYALQLLTPRFSEISRAGVVSFCDASFQIGRPLIGDWFMTTDHADLRQRIDFLNTPAGHEFRLESIAYQRGQLNRYCAARRYTETLFLCAQRLLEGELDPTDPFRLSLYDDLLIAAHLQPWHA